MKQNNSRHEKFNGHDTGSSTDNIDVFIAASPLFRKLDLQTARAIISRGTFRDYDKNEIVITEGSEKRLVGFAVKGLFVCRRCSPNGLVLALQNIRPGNVFCEMSLIDVSANNIEVASGADKSCALLFPVKVFRELMLQHPALSGSMIEEMAGRINSLAELSFELATMKTDDRLRRAISKLALETDQLHDGGMIYPAPTHAELASMLGTTREVVSRSIIALCREGLIETSRQSITIRSAHALM
ncbi:Crp/Fnr family transcriptional regulator [Rhizobium paknamense]|uniref:CRP-like cAMP-binding protein n=1 Tax=Rhizobium paknamense TaxID=1206817 RepID=A0ABU0IEY3_9HYPH|nr:Crp/Fnr family transcriptional regulator [Rhizobium paknamense]MDQ0456218.1 CRP-like cAMP-binding protein [Rhizobium paknamense]